MESFVFCCLESTHAHCAGEFVVNCPMVLGHEASGFVAKVGPGVHHLQVRSRRRSPYLQTMRLTVRLELGKMKTIKTVTYVITVNSSPFPPRPPAPSPNKKCVTKNHSMIIVVQIVNRELSLCTKLGRGKEEN